MGRTAAAILLSLVPSFVWAGDWAKYVAPDKSFSLHYPAGWRVTADGGSVEFAKGASGERLTLLSVPPDFGDTPRAIAEKVIDSIRQGGITDLAVKQWRDSDQPDTSVSLQAAYTEEGRSFLGDVLVVKAEGIAIWVSYAVPQVDYSAERSQALLSAVLGSLATGDTSAEPEVALPEIPTQQVDADARAFLFVLEFAMGAPFSASQESVVTDAFKAAMGQLTADQRAKFDEYPKLMTGIMSLKQEAVEPMRRDLRQTLREALAESGDDPALAIVAGQLDESAEVVAQGPPVLLRVAAQATGELLAYGRLLGTDPQAAPDDLDPKVAATIRDETIATWDSLDEDTRSLVTDAPGIWMVVRTVMRTGPPAEQAALREQLAALASAQITPKQETGAADQPAPGSANEGEGGKPTSWVTHNALMSMNQMTFNTNMWSHGYQGWTPMGKIW